MSDSETDAGANDPSQTPEEVGDAQVYEVTAENGGDDPTHSKGGGGEDLNEPAADPALNIEIPVTGNPGTITNPQIGAGVISRGNPDGTTTYTAENPGEQVQIWRTNNGHYRIVPVIPG
jgi:hypothetical protein